MPLTQRFDQLIKELDLPGAAWHLGRTNSGTEKHATDEEIEIGRQQILNLLSNNNNSVGVILEQIDRELQSIEPMNALLQKRQEVTLASWGKPITDVAGRTEYTDAIHKIQQRILLENTKKQAELILNGGFRVIQGDVQSEKSASEKLNQFPLIIGPADGLKNAA